MKDKRFVLLAGVVALMAGAMAMGECPSADLTGDCFVDFADFAEMAAQWLTTSLPDDMVYVPLGTFQMGDNLDDGSPDEKPVHTVMLSAFAMGRYEVTNGQYCAFLNSALELGLIEVIGGTVYKAGSGTSYPYCDTSEAFSAYSQIDYNNGNFSVRTKGDRDMTNDPMVLVSWYGAAAYCNWRSWYEGYEICYDTDDPNWPCDFGKYGYRMGTEAEWEYAARGGLSGRRFPWGDTITHSQANYYSYWNEGIPYYSYDISPASGNHPLWADTNPYTSPAGFFDGTLKDKSSYNWPGSDTSYQTTSGANEYGLYDMAGNVWEWCNDWYGEYGLMPQTNPTGPVSGTYRVFRGGNWEHDAYGCRVAYRGSTGSPDMRGNCSFRVVLDMD